MIQYYSILALTVLIQNKIAKINYKIFKVNDHECESF